MRVVIAGGGTGGHVFPAIAVGSEFVRRNAKVTFVGTKKGLESELVPRRGWKISYLSAPRWKGESILKRLLAIVYVPFAVLGAVFLLLKLRPDLVVGVGGYASFPVLAAAYLMMKPTLVMEQNSVPGLTNRILGRFVKKVCLTYPSSAGFFKSDKVVVTGNPVREEICEVGNRLPPFDHKFVVMCFGGSQGAKSINEAMLASLKFLRGKKDSLKIIHQVGFNMDVEVVKKVYADEGFDADVYSFIDHIADCYAEAHLAICRAGATSVAELTVVARPAILIPYPFAANNHQELNAMYVVDNGGAELLLNSDLSGEKLALLIIGFVNHPSKLEAMNEAMKKLAKPDAAQAIVDEGMKLVVNGDW